MTDRRIYPAQEKPFGAFAAQVPIPAPLMKLPALNSFFTLLSPHIGQFIVSSSPKKISFSKEWVHFLH
jgi:hypothetical protein